MYSDGGTKWGTCHYTSSAFVNHNHSFSCSRAKAYRKHGSPPAYMVPVIFRILLSEVLYDIDNDKCNTGGIQ